jgi:two-component system cell cycle response regulator CpdR
MARILLAEDDAAVREFVRRALIHSGHRVAAVDSGRAAKAALAAEAFDLLLSDIVMPGLDGIDLALYAAGADPGMAILLMTGYAAERQRAHRIDALAYRVISKPFTLREICAAVNETLARRDTQTSVA